MALSSSYPVWSLLVFVGFLLRLAVAQDDPRFTELSLPPSTIVSLENSSITLTCLVELDDDVIGSASVVWSDKNGAILGIRPGFVVSTAENETLGIVESNVTFALTSTTAGTYQCRGLLRVLPVWTAPQSVQVLIAVAPVVTTVVESTYVEGENAMLSCSATGLPQPVLEWRFNGSTLLSRNTSTLVFRRPGVSRTEAGDYTCRASNIAGKHEMMQKLVVEFKPDIVTISDTKLVPVNSGITLNCMARGVPPPHVTWVHHRHNLSVVSHVVVSHARDSHVGGMLGHSNVTSAAVMATDAGQYTCVATNSVGRRRKHVQVTVQTEPDAPVFSRHTPSRTYVDVSWLEPAYHNSSLIGYDVDVRLLDGEWENVTVDDPLTRSARIMGLTPWTQYEVRVRAQNGIGYSAWSAEPLVIRTHPVDPLPPDNVTIVAYPTSLQVGWKYPAAWEREMGELSKIVVMYGQHPVSEPLKMRDFYIPAGVRSGAVNISDLQKGTLHQVLVRSSNNYTQSSEQTAVERMVNTTTTTEPTTEDPSIRVTEAGKADNSKVIVAVAGAVGAGVVVVLVVIVIVLVMKSRRNRHQKDGGGGGLARLPEHQGSWRSNSLKNATSPIAERLDNSYTSTPVHQASRGVSSHSMVPHNWLQHQDSNLSGQEMLETDQVAGHVRAEEQTTFTSFGKKVPSSPLIQPPEYMFPPGISPPKTPPGTPPASPGHALEVKEPYEYSQLKGRPAKSDAAQGVAAQSVRASAYERAAHESAYAQPCKNKHANSMTSDDSHNIHSGGDGIEDFDLDSYSCTYAPMPVKKNTSTFQPLEKEQNGAEERKDTDV